MEITTIINAQITIISDRKHDIEIDKEEWKEYLEYTLDVDDVKIESVKYFPAENDN